MALHPQGGFRVGRKGLQLRGLYDNGLPCKVFRIWVEDLGNLNRKRSPICKSLLGFLMPKQRLRPTVHYDSCNIDKHAHTIV